MQIRIKNYEEQHINNDIDQRHEEQETTVSDIIKALLESNKPALESKGDHVMGQKDAQSQTSDVMILPKPKKLEQ